MTGPSPPNLENTNVKDLTHKTTLDKLKPGDRFKFITGKVEYVIAPEQTQKIFHDALDYDEVMYTDIKTGASYKGSKWQACLAVEPPKPKKVYRVGQTFMVGHYNRDRCILANIGNYQLRMISLENGNRYADDPAPFANPNAITEDEVRRACAQSSFEVIE